MSVNNVAFRPVDFVTPQWLAAIGAVAVPVALHLIRREQFQRCEIATLRFLAAAVRERGGRQRVANWPLLIVRALALAALALLLARPFQKDLTPPTPAGADALVLCDVSGSQARGNSEEIGQVVRRRISQLPPTAHITFARFADTVESAERTEDLFAIPGAGTDFNAAIEWAIDRSTQAGGAPMRVFLVSDFPRSVIRNLAPRLWPAGTEVELIRTGKEDAWNIGIERVELLTPVAAGEVALEAYLTTGGQPPRESVEIRVQADGSSERLEQRIEPGQTKVRFQWKSEIPPEGLLLKGKVELLPSHGDAVSADNSRPFAFTVTRQRSALLVDGDPGESVFAGETYFLEKALKSVTRTDEVPLFRTEVRPRLADPRGFDVVALCNVAEITSEEAQQLGEYVAGGGSLLITTGKNTQPALFDALASAGIEFGKVTAVNAGETQPCAIADPTHVALQKIVATAGDDWKRLQFWQTFRLQSSPGATSLLTFQDNSPLLAEASPKSGTGRALAFLHSIDRQDSEFPREPLFVPWVRELFGYLTHASEPKWKIREVAMSLREPRNAGVYSEGSEVTVVAPNANEIDITPASLPEVQSLVLATPAKDQNVTAPAATILHAVAPGRLRPRELWPIAAVALFAFLLIEGLLSSRAFARRR